MSTESPQLGHERARADARTAIGAHVGLLRNIILLHEGRARAGKAVVLGGLAAGFLLEACQQIEAAIGTDPPSIEHVHAARQMSRAAASKHRAGPFARVAVTLSEAAWNYVQELPDVAVTLADKAASDLARMEAV